jgi:hypothetical protein
MTSNAAAVRATIAGGPEGLEIVIPASRNLVLAIFLGMWLAGWLMGEWNAIAQLGRAAALDPFLVLWLAGWTAAGIAVAYVWLWTLAGRERIVMGTSTLRVKREVLGLGWTRAYPLSKIRNLRVTPRLTRPGSPNVAFGLAGFTGGAIAFECEGKTIRFGASLEDAEAHIVVERMRQRHNFPDAAVPDRRLS